MLQTEKVRKCLCTGVYHKQMVLHGKQMCHNLAQHHDYNEPPSTMCLLTMSGMNQTHTVQRQLSVTHKAHFDLIWIK